MTERYDPKLVEAVARVIARAYDLDPEDDAWEVAQAVIAKVDASGTHQIIDLSTHWAAPLEPSLEQLAAGFGTPPGEFWRRVRDACRAERRGEGAVSESWSDRYKNRLDPPACSDWREMGANEIDDLKRALAAAEKRIVVLEAFIADQRRWNDEHVAKLQARIAELESDA